MTRECCVVDCGAPGAFTVFSVWVCARHWTVGLVYAIGDWMRQPPQPSVRIQA